MTDLKEVYKASTEELAYLNLEKLNDKWGSKYTLAVRPWLVHWDNLRTYYTFPKKNQKFNLYYKCCRIFA